MPKKLTQLIVDRVDLVDQGANPDSHIVLFKRALVAKTAFTDLLNLQEFQEVVFEILDMCMTLEDAIFSSLYADGDRAAEIKTSVQQFGDAVTEALASWMKGDPVEQRDATVVLQKIKARLRHMVKEGLVPDEKDQTETPPAPETPPTPAPEPTEEQIIKSLPESLRQRLALADSATEAIAKAAADVAKAEASRVEAERIAKEATDNAELLTFQKRAETEFPKLPGTAEQRARVLIAMRTLPETVQTTLTEMLKAGHTALAKGFEDLGREENLSGETVTEKVRRLSNERVSKGLSKTVEQATQDVLTADDELYKAYRKEQSDNQKNRR